MPTKVTRAVAMEIIGRKNKCSILPAVWYAATALAEPKILLKSITPIDMIIILSDAGTPKRKILRMISKLYLKALRLNVT